MQNTLNTHIIFKKESVQIGYSLFEQSKMDKMKKNKFDARFLNKIVTIFSIIFIVILVMATLFHCLYDAFSNVIVQFLYLAFPIVLAMLDIICFICQKKPREKKKREDAGGENHPEEKITKKIEERLLQLVNNILSLLKNTILELKKYLPLLKYTFLMSWAASLVIINDVRFNMNYILLLLCKIAGFIYVFLLFAEIFKLVRMNIKPLILITLVSMIFGSIKSTQIRWGISIIGNMILYIIDYDFFRFVYKKYRNYIGVSPKENAESGKADNDFEKTSSYAKIRLKNWKVLIGLATCIINILIAITDMYCFSKLISKIAEWGSNGLLNNDNSPVIIFLTNVLTILWTGIAKFAVILIIVAMGIILVRKLEKYKRNKIEKFFLYIFAVQEES